MEKQVITADVPETGGPFNLCVRHGDLIYVSGLPPFEAAYCEALRQARTRLKESREQELQALLAPEARQALERHGIELVNYLALSH